MAWRLARSLEALRGQINAAYPNRSKASDGTIGDKAHSHRPSDHNPEGDGTVDALDITHDPSVGLDIQALCDALVASRDARIKYIICNGKIIAGREGPSSWKVRRYNGSNKHTKHIHVSVLDAGQDNVTPWKIKFPVAPPKPEDGILRKGSKGPFVTELQTNLNRLGYPVKIDGVFGDGTETAVRGFQKRSGLSVDGWAGPRTIDAIGKALAEKAAKPKIEAAEKTVPETAAEEVEQKTGWWQKITGFFGAGGMGIGALYGIEWQTIAVVAGAVIILLLVLFLMRRQIIAAYREINAGLAK